jgi:hypothetical protein
MVQIFISQKKSVKKMLIIASIAISLLIFLVVAIFSSDVLLLLKYPHPEFNEDHQRVYYDHCKDKGSSYTLLFDSCKYSLICEWHFGHDFTLLQTCNPKQKYLK